MCHARRALERLGALDGLDAEEIEAVGVGLFPLFAGQKVILVGGRQVGGDLAKVGILEVFGKVCVVRDLDLGLHGHERIRNGLHHRAAVLGLRDNRPAREVLGTGHRELDLRNLLVHAALHEAAIGQGTCHTRCDSHQ